MTNIEPELQSKLDSGTPHVIRCFKTTKNALPDTYHERISHCYELEYIPWGNGSVITDGVSFPAVAGSVFFRIPGMKIHGILPYASCGILFENCPFDDLPKYSTYDTSHQISFLFQETYKNYLFDDVPGQIKMKANIMNILYYLYCQSNCPNITHKPVTLDEHKSRLKLLTDYIEENLSDYITLNALSHICDVSPGFLCRLFKQSYNESIFTYINRRRIHRAKRLLIETNNPIKDICISCGFENESYFYRTFKRNAQVSPTTFRKSHREPFGL